MSRAGGATRRNEQYVKVQRHVGEIMHERMMSQNITAERLAEQSGVPLETILDIIDKTTGMSVKSSENIGIVLGLGKANLYKAHLRFMETGGK